MSSYRFVVEYRTEDGDRRRVIYRTSATCVQWIRIEQRYHDGHWQHVGSEPISPPQLQALPFGIETFAGP